MKFNASSVAIAVLCGLDLGAPLFAALETISRCSALANRALASAALVDAIAREPDGDDWSCVPRVAEIKPPPSAGGSRVIDTRTMPTSTSMWKEAPGSSPGASITKPHKNLIIARKTSPASTNPLNFSAPESPIPCLFVDARLSGLGRHCRNAAGAVLSAPVISPPRGQRVSRKPFSSSGLGFRISKPRSRCGLAVRAPRWRLLANVTAAFNRSPRATSPRRSRAW